VPVVRRKSCLGGGRRRNCENVARMCGECSEMDALGKLPRLCTEMLVERLGGGKLLSRGGNAWRVSFGKPVDGPLCPDGMWWVVSVRVTLGPREEL